MPITLPAYPTNGWYWSDNKEDANLFFNIPTAKEAGNSNNPSSILIP